MTTKLVLGSIFLLVSLSSLAMQGHAWWTLHRQRPPDAPVAADVHRGLARTAACRVAAAILYVGVGITTVTMKPPPLLALAVFTVVQVLWQINAVADLRLRRRIARTPPAHPPAPVRPAQPARPARPPVQP